LNTLSLFKKLKPPKQLKADRNKPFFFAFSQKNKISFLTTYTSSGEWLGRTASTLAGYK
jgi:hypothetical protein